MITTILCLLFGLTCIPSIAETDLEICSFYYWRSSWQSAVRTCARDQKELLCYRSRKEINDITQAFQLAFGDAELDLWLANKNCSGGDKYVECLSLHITKSDDSLWHYFEEDCDVHYPFICCLPGTGSQKPTMLTAAIEPTPSTTAISITPAAEVCPTVQRRGLLWPNTRISEFAALPCPGNYTGSAKWKCEAGGQWNKLGPDMSECRNTHIGKLLKKWNLTDPDNVLQFLRELLDGMDSQLLGEDLADVLAALAALPPLLAGSLGFDQNTTRLVADKAMAVFDKIILRNDSWQDVSPENRSVLGTSLLSTVDKVGLLLSNSMSDDEEQLTMKKDQIELQVLRREIGQQVFLNEESSKGNILLEKGYDEFFDVSYGNVSIVFAVYFGMYHILSPQQNADEQFENSCLNSPVVSAIVAQGQNVTVISSPVRITVQHRISQPNGTVCVFWNTHTHAWDRQGCRLVESNATFSTCECNHLTNFAVLMDYRGVLSDVNPLPFFYITVIGCSLSVISLAACVLVFTCYSFQSKHSWGLRYAIHRNLSLTLLVANLVLMLGIDRTDNRDLCAVIAGVLHYFFLSAFSWMLLEGLHIYLLLVVVFASRRSHWEKYYLFGYGAPLIIVIITAMSRPHYYGTQNACWLSTEKGTIWAFMGPVAVILIMNLSALSLAQWKASRISIKHDNLALFRRWLRVTLILFPVLGITWIFGFLFIGAHVEAIGYIFAVLNSLQGVSIFICHCMLDKNARNSVISSLKKKTASVDTGSSNTNKKKKDSSSSTQNVQKVDIMGTFREAWRRNWAKWHKPWSFCFEMSVTENNHQNKIDNQPNPIILQNSNLEEKDPDC